MHRGNDRLERHENVHLGNSFDFRSQRVNPSVDLLFVFGRVSVKVGEGDVPGSRVLRKLVVEVFVLGKGEEAVVVGVCGCKGGTELGHLCGFAFL